MGPSEWIALVALVVAGWSAWYSWWSRRPAPKVVARWPRSSARAAIVLDSVGSATAFDVDAAIDWDADGQPASTENWGDYLPVSRLDVGAHFGLPIWHAPGLTTTYRVTVSWSRRPGGRREELEYPLSVIRDQPTPPQRQVRAFDF